MLQESGKFRKDLYYRLCAHNVHIPPLRERREDLPLLVEHFLEKSSVALGKKKPTPPNELLILLSSYHFPGNIRELEAMIWDAVSYHKLGKQSLDAFKTHITNTQPSIEADFKLPLQNENGIISFSEQLPTLKQAEHLLISEALKRSDGNQAIAALNLGITRQALNRRLKRSER